MLDMPKLIAAVSASDLERVANTYLVPAQRTIGWMIPGKNGPATGGAGDPRPAHNRPGQPSPAIPAGKPELRRLSGGLPAIIQSSPLSDAVTVELLMSAPVEGGSHPDDLVGLDAIVREGPSANLTQVLQDAAGTDTRAPPERASEDPATRLQQLIVAQTGDRRGSTPAPLAVIVSGNVSPATALAALERQFGRSGAGKLAAAANRSSPPRFVREKIDKPLAQGGIGYVVEGPAPGSRDALIWRMLLYVLTHDYSGRLGNSAIRDKGLVYHIYSLLRTDGHRTWATISTGVDPDKADAMEAELRAQIARLATDPPTQAEVDAARNHLLGRDLTAAQSNEELAAKLAREFVETGGLRSHEQLAQMLMTMAAGAPIAMRATSANGACDSCNCAAGMMPMITVELSM